jgi:hypothetical protein
LCSVKCMYVVLVVILYYVLHKLKSDFDTFEVSYIWQLLHTDI